MRGKRNSLVGMCGPSGGLVIRLGDLGIWDEGLGTGWGGRRKQGRGNNSDARGMTTSGWQDYARDVPELG